MACLPFRLTKFHGSLRAPALPPAAVVNDLVSTHTDYYKARLYQEKMFATNVHVYIPAVISIIFFIVNIW